MAHNLVRNQGNAVGNHGKWHSTYLRMAEMKKITGNRCRGYGARSASALFGRDITCDPAVSLLNDHQAEASAYVCAHAHSSSIYTIQKPSICLQDGAELNCGKQECTVWPRK